MGCTKSRLTIGLSTLRQGDQTGREYVHKFKQKAVDSQILEEYAKVLLVNGLNKDSLTRLGSYISSTC